MIPPRFQDRFNICFFGKIRAEVYGAWIIVLSLASESPVRGSLYVTTMSRVTSASLSRLLGRDIVESQELLDEFVNHGIAAQQSDGLYVVVNWKKRQDPRDPTAAERKRREREKKMSRNVTRDMPVTSRVEDRGQRIILRRRRRGGSRFASICQKYSQEIGALTPRIRDVLLDAMKDYPEPGWIEAAIDEGS